MDVNNATTASRFPPQAHRCVCSSIRELKVEDVVHQLLHLVYVSKNAPSHGMITDRLVLVAIGHLLSVLNVALSALCEKHSKLMQVINS